MSRMFLFGRKSEKSTTGDVAAKDIQSFLGKSGRPFLPKPFTPDKLRSMVAKAMTEIEQ